MHQWSSIHAWIDDHWSILINAWIDDHWSTPRNAWFDDHWSILINAWIDDHWSIPRNAWIDDQWSIPRNFMRLLEIFSEGSRMDLGLAAARDLGAQLPRSYKMLSFDNICNDLYFLWCQGENWRSGYIPQPPPKSSPRLCPFVLILGWENCIACRQSLWLILGSIITLTASCLDYTTIAYTEIS